MEIIPLLPEHWPAVRAIYGDGLATGQASFQTSAPTWEDWDAAHLKHSRLVATNAHRGQGIGNTVLLEKRS